MSKWRKRCLLDKYINNFDGGMGTMAEMKTNVKAVWNG
jgi:hypothetical protein